MHSVHQISKHDVYFFLIHNSFYPLSQHRVRFLDCSFVDILGFLIYSLKGKAVLTLHSLKMLYLNIQDL